MNRFRKYLNSPYFNKDKRLINLLEYYCIKLFEKTSAEELDETTVWNGTFKKQKEDFKLLRRLNSDLLTQITKYIGQQELEKDKLLNNNLIFKGVGHRKISEIYGSIKRSNEKDLQRYPEISSEYYFAKYQHELTNSDLKSEIDKKKSKSNVESEITIDRVSYNLDQFYIIEKLKLYISLLSWNRSYKVEKTIDHIDEIKLILGKEKGTNEVITAYLTIVKTLEEPEREVWFKMLRTQVENRDIKFSTSDFKYIYDALLGYSVNKLNSGETSYLPISFDIYKHALEAGALFNEDKITSITFNNIVGIALRNGEYSWAENFVLEYSEKLDKVSKANTKSFSLSRIQFYRKNYNQVIEILREVEYQTVFYNLNSKSLLLFSYYEMGEFDALDSLINSFKVYLNRERSISASRKKRYNQLLGFVKRIANINPRDQKKIERLKEKLAETKGVLNKAWLTEKLEKIQNNKSH